MLLLPPPKNEGTKASKQEERRRKLAERQEQEEERRNREEGKEKVFLSEYFFPSRLSARVCICGLRPFFSLRRETEEMDEEEDAWEH